MTIPAYEDPCHFPKMGQYLGYSFDATAMSKFQVNVSRGCALGNIESSYATNPNQVNFIYSGKVDGSHPCSNELGYSVTYGNGYWDHATPLVSPYPGVGTIRAWTLADKIKDLQGDVWTDPTWGHEVINMCSSGNDELTAEWAARLRAHHALTWVGGDFAAHPAVHGIYADNDLYWDAGYNRSNMQGTAATWDDGLVRNHQKLRAILGNDVLIGGNGAHYTCTGMHGKVYYGTIPDGDCTSVDASLYESGSDKFDWIEAWDNNVPQMYSWFSSGLPGRARYGMMTVYGGDVQTRLGRPLTVQDKRLALAHATCAGWALWITVTNSWGTTIIPGSADSIPEMGGTAQYPAGWLGLPIEGPIRIASGHWRRRFTNGVIYANVLTSGSWSVDGYIVPARDALFVQGASGFGPKIEIGTASAWQSTEQPPEPPPSEGVFALVSRKR